MKQFLANWLAVAVSIAWIHGTNAGGSGLATGHSEQLPGPTQVGIAADQTSARMLLGADVAAPGGGTPLGRIASIYLDLQTLSVDMVELSLPQGEHRPLISLSDIDVVKQPAPHLATRLSPEQLARAPAATEEALARKMNIASEIIDRDVQSKAGSSVGKAHDIVFDYDGGTPRALVVILPDGRPALHRNAVAVPWDKVELNRVGNPISVALDAQAVASLPEFGFLRPQGDSRPPNPDQLNK